MHRAGEGAGEGGGVGAKVGGGETGKFGGAEDSRDEARAGAGGGKVCAAEERGVEGAGGGARGLETWGACRAIGA